MEYPAQRHRTGTTFRAFYLEKNQRMADRGYPL